MNGYAPVHNGELYYDVQGEGHPLVLIHAGVADHTMWDEHVPVLAQRFRVIRYDTRGYGRSRTEDTEYSEHEDLRDLLDHLQAPVAHVLGISRGAGFAIDFAVAYPERVSALVVVAGGPGGLDWPEDYDDPVGMAAEEAIGAASEAGDWERVAELESAFWADGPGQPEGRAPAGVRERVRRWTLDYYTRKDGKVQQVRLQPPAGKRLHEIHVPTLVLAGDIDEKATLIMADAAARGIPGARQVVFPRVAHMVPLEIPDQFNEIVMSFLP